jgi:hypothetical protein
MYTCACLASYLGMPAPQPHWQPCSSSATPVLMAPACSHRASLTPRTGRTPSTTRPPPCSCAPNHGSPLNLLTVAHGYGNFFGISSARCDRPSPSICCTQGLDRQPLECPALDAGYSTTPAAQHVTHPHPTYHRMCCTKRRQQHGHAAWLCMPLHACRSTRQCTTAAGHLLAASMAPARKT